jgi:hypothetical protein
MAIYRQIQTTFWSDTFVTELTPEQKYFYIYLLTNDKTKQCGIYEITLRAMSFDTGYNTETIEKLLSMFQSANKIRWSKETSEIALKNWSKYNNHRSPLVQVCIKKELKLVKNPMLIEYVYPIDTILQQEQTQEEEQEEKEEETKKADYNPETDIIYYLYPSECPIKGNSTSKGSKNKEKIRKIIKEKGFDWLHQRVTAYLVDCKKNKVWLKNFTTFLNNIPDLPESGKPIESDMVLFRWKHDPTGIERKVKKADAENYFESQALGGYIAELL